MILGNNMIIDVEETQKSDEIYRYDATVDVKTDKGFKQFTLWLEFNRRTNDCDELRPDNIDSNEDLENFGNAMSRVRTYARKQAHIAKYHAGEIDLRTLVGRLLGYEREEPDPEEEYYEEPDPEELDLSMSPNDNQQN